MAGLADEGVAKHPRVGSVPESKKELVRRGVANRERAQKQADSNKWDIDYLALELAALERAAANPSITLDTCECMDDPLLCVWQPCTCTPYWLLEPVEPFYCAYLATTSSIRPCSSSVVRQ